MACYFEFEVSLKRIQPRIWRRLLIHSESTFRDLHAALQAAFEWGDVHLWEFRSPGTSGRTLAGVSVDSRYAWEGSAPDAGQVALSQYFSGVEGERCVYVYDFGDCWEHVVRLTAVAEVPELFERRLVAGDRNGPPQNCGGIRGYARCVAIANGEVHTASDTIRADRIRGWDPDAFDLAQAQVAFAR